MDENIRCPSQLNELDLILLRVGLTRALPYKGNPFWCQYRSRPFPLEMTCFTLFMKIVGTWWTRLKFGSHRETCVKVGMHHRVTRPATIIWVEIEANWSTQARNQKCDEGLPGKIHWRTHLPIYYWRWHGENDPVMPVKNLYNSTACGTFSPINQLILKIQCGRKAMRTCPNFFLPMT
jgi:hypothetical protein